MEYPTPVDRRKMRVDHFAYFTEIQIFGLYMDE